MFIKNLQKSFILKNTSFIFLILLIIIISFVNYPQLISLWESGVVYESFKPSEKPLLFLAIQKAGGSSGFHGLFGYSLLEVSRYFSDFFGHSISNIRFIPFFYGILSVLLFFIIVKKYFDLTTAFVSTSLFLTNLHFIIFQNSFLPHSLTMLSILFCIERFLNFKTQQNKFAAITLGLAFAFASINHIAGRIVMLAILLLCLFDFEFFIRKTKNIITKKSINNFLIIALSAFVFLSIFYPLNILRLFTPEFLFPDVGEDVSNSGSSFIIKSFHNLKYFFHYFIFGMQDPNYPSNIMAGRPYTLVNPIVFIFSIYGLFLGFRDFKNFNKFFFIYLGAIIFFGILQSKVIFDRPFEISSSLLNANRTYYLLPFIMIFSSFGFVKIYRKIKSTGELIKKLSILFFFFFILFRLYFFINESNRFQAYINSYNFDFTKKAIEKDLSSINSEHGELLHKDKLQLHLNQIYFHNLANYILEKTKKHHNEKNKIKLIYVPKNYYTPNFVQYEGTVAQKEAPYYFKMFLTFYLRENGMNVTYLANLNELRPNIIYRVIDVVDNFDQRKNDPGLYPRDKKQEKTVFIIKKIISWIENYSWGKKLTQSIRLSKNPDLNLKTVDSFYINTTSNKDPEYLILSSTNELKAAKLLRDTKIVLVMPEKVDK